MGGARRAPRGGQTNPAGSAGVGNGGREGAPPRGPPGKRCGAVLPARPGRSRRYRAGGAGRAGKAAPLPGLHTPHPAPGSPPRRCLAGRSAGSGSLGFLFLFDRSVTAPAAGPRVTTRRVSIVSCAPLSMAQERDGKAPLADGWTASPSQETGIIKKASKSLKPSFSALAKAQAL